MGPTWTGVGGWGGASRLWRTQQLSLPHCRLVHTNPDPCPQSPFLTLSAWQMKCSGAFDTYITRPFCMHHGRLLYVIAAWGGWARGGLGGP